MTKNQCWYPFWSGIMFGMIMNKIRTEVYHSVHDTDSISYFTFEYLLNTVIFDKLFCKHLPVTPADREAKLIISYGLKSPNFLLIFIKTEGFIFKIIWELLY